MVISPEGALRGAAPVGVVDAAADALSHFVFEAGTLDGDIVDGWVGTGFSRAAGYGVSSGRRQPPAASSLAWWVDGGGWSIQSLVHIYDDTKDEIAQRLQAIHRGL